VERGGEGSRGKQRATQTRFKSAGSLYLFPVVAWTRLGSRLPAAQPPRPLPSNTSPRPSSKQQLGHKSKQAAFQSPPRSFPLELTASLAHYYPLATVPVPPPRKRHQTQPEPESQRDDEPTTDATKIIAPRPARRRRQPATTQAPYAP
jgi:hypothetical protein